MSLLRCRKFVVVGAVCVLAFSATTVKANPQHSVNVSGATLFKAFFEAPASTNDFIDVDGNGYYGYHSTPPFVEQLADDFAVPYATWTPYWGVMYRGVGSGTGLAELVNYYNKQPGMEMTVPADQCDINRTRWCSASGGVVAPGNLANPGGCPFVPATIDIAVMDVPTTWFITQSGTGSPIWGAKPLTSGYGNNAVKSYDGNQSNKLKSLTGTVAPINTLNLNSPADVHTVVDTPVAWVPIAFIANRGTGLQNVDMSELQYLYITGRTKNGANLVGAMRDSGSGTRNAAMNSIGVDPSYGAGDNTGAKTPWGRSPTSAPGTWTATWMARAWLPTRSRTSASRSGTSVWIRPDRTQPWASTRS